MRNRIESQSYWLEQSTQWALSGLTQKKFCEQQGLNYWQFVSRRGRVPINKVSKSEAKLLKVSTTTTRLENPAPRVGASHLEVLLPLGIKRYLNTVADLSKASALIQLLGAAR